MDITVLYDTKTLLTRIFFHFLAGLRIKQFMHSYLQVATKKVPVP